MNSVQRTCKGWGCRDLFRKSTSRLARNEVSAALRDCEGAMVMILRIFWLCLIALGVFRLNSRITLFFPKRELEFALNEMLNALIACQTQTDQRAFALQVDVKIEKGAALAFGNHPIG